MKQLRETAEGMNDLKRQRRIGNKGERERERERTKDERYESL